MQKATGRSGNNDRIHYNGVVTLVSSAFAKLVIDFFPILDCLMVSNIVQVNAPTNDNEDNMVD